MLGCLLQGYSSSNQGLIKLSSSFTFEWLAYWDVSSSNSDFCAFAELSDGYVGATINQQFLYKFNKTSGEVLWQQAISAQTSVGTNENILIVRNVIVLTLIR